MAVIPGLTTYPEKNVMAIVWTAVAAADTFGAVKCGSKYTDRVVAVTSTFDGATVLIKGSLDGTNYFTLDATSTAGTASYTAAGQDTLVDSTPYLQPTHSGGGGTESVTVTILLTAYM